MSVETGAPFRDGLRDWCINWGGGEEIDALFGAGVR